eukprot:TRINITY_DN5450_c0_g2_i3.p1 TRINITY_DN5450_c0_g2~~TRINITY_DN5450_c0_g2_i3.p1  ORF type:complete len:124 (-),score=23.56 TRINITY_DN5450_c0_g2_i3:376-747(-)
MMIRHKQGGNIINIGSVIGSSGNVGQTAYSASKAGLVGVTKTWAKELAPKGIRVNIIEPGFITTDMTQDIPEEKKAAFISQIPLKRFGTEEDVMSAVDFIIQNKYLTGQSIVIDGGLTLNNWS